MTKIEQIHRINKNMYIEEMGYGEFCLWFRDFENYIDEAGAIKLRDFLDKYLKIFNRKTRTQGEKN